MVVKETSLDYMEYFLFFSIKKAKLSAFCFLANPRTGLKDKIM